MADKLLLTFPAFIRESPEHKWIYPGYSDRGASIITHSVKDEFLPSIDMGSVAWNPVLLSIPCLGKPLH